MTILSQLTYWFDTGALAYFRTRPYNRMPVPSELPSAIFVNACDTNPLSVDPHELIKLDQDLFNKGLNFIKSINDEIKNFLFLSKQKILINQWKL